MCSWVELTKVVTCAAESVPPEPPAQLLNVTTAPGWKLVPFTSTEVPPALGPKLGTTVVIVGDPGTTKYPTRSAITSAWPDELKMLIAPVEPSAATTRLGMVTPRTQLRSDAVGRKAVDG